jgi:hypothetical protein
MPAQRDGSTEAVAAEEGGGMLTVVGDGSSQQFAFSRVFGR